MSRTLQPIIILTQNSRQRSRHWWVLYSKLACSIWVKFQTSCKLEHIVISRPNVPKILISSQDPQFSNIIFKIDELDLLWVQNFIVLGIYLFLGPDFPGMRGLMLALKSNLCYLAVIFNFLVVTARYRLLLLVPTFSMSAKKVTFRCHALKSIKNRNKLIK